MNEVNELEKIKKKTQVILTRITYMDGCGGLLL